MDDMLINGGLAMLLLELVKWGIRFLKKNPQYDFPTAFYAVSIPVLNILVLPLLALLGVSNVTMPTDWVEWIRSALLVGVGSLVSLLFYSGGYKKLKEYNDLLKETRSYDEFLEEERDEEEEREKGKG